MNNRRETARATVGLAAFVILAQMLDCQSACAVSVPPEVDVWPSLDEAVRAAALPVIQYLDQLPDLRERTCAIRSRSNTTANAQAAATLRLILSEQGFDCTEIAMDAPTHSPAIELDHWQFGDAGTVAIQAPQPGPTGTGRYRNVSWATTDAPPLTRRGPFIIVVGRSKWQPELEVARAEAVEDALRVLRQYGVVARGAVNDPAESYRQYLWHAQRDDFIQSCTSQRVSGQRMVSRFVLHADDLSGPVLASPPEWQWFAPLTVGALVIVVSALLWIRRRL